MITAYPNLTAEIAKRGIKKRTIAQAIGVCDKALSNKINGKTEFTWSETGIIRNTFFPDMDKDTLFARGLDTQQSA